MDGQTKKVKPRLPLGVVLKLRKKGIIKDKRKDNNKYKCRRDKNYG